MDYKQEFIDVFNKNIERRGSDKLLSWLLETDFFESPASSKFHSCYEGGLLKHSLNVYNVMMDKHFDEQLDSKESFTIVSLLHDVCKAGFYKKSFKNVKDANGTWQQVAFYIIDDKFPFGHGEKSVFLVERFMRIDLNEAMAIRWHMGGFDDNAKAGGFCVSNAFGEYPLAVKLHLSDLEATYLYETKHQ